MYRFAPETEGHGTDAALDAFHKRAALVSFQVPVVKAFASSATIGFGGSGGVEGPSVQMGAGIGSSIARILRLSLESRRIVMLSGMAAALSALFQAPLGTALFVVEVLYKRDLETRAVIPAILSSIIAYAITASLFDFQPVLPTLKADITALYSAKGLISLAFLGVIIAPLAILYVVLFYRVKGFMEKLVERGMPIYLKPIIGAIFAGTIAIVFPHVIGSGRDMLSLVLESEHNRGVWDIMGLPLTFTLLLIALAKMAATALSIGSGGSGGVFAPSLLIGALIGSCYGLGVATKIAPLDPSVYAYVGMAAFFGAAAKVPFSAAILVGEMGRNYLLIPPALLVGVVARELTGDRSIYASQLRSRLRAEVISAEYLYEILKSKKMMHVIRAREIANHRPRPARLNEPLINAIESMLASRTKATAVVDSSEKVIGVLEEADMDSLLALAQRRPDLRVGEVKLKQPPLVGDGESIEDVLEKMLYYDKDYVIVSYDTGKYYGVITVDDILLVLAHIIHDHLEEIKKKEIQRV